MNIPEVALKPPPKNLIIQDPPSEQVTQTERQPPLIQLSRSGWRILQGKTGDQQVILSTWFWIANKFHSKGLTFLSTQHYRKNWRIWFKILMAPSSGQLLKLWISSYLLTKPTYPQNLYNLLHPTNSTSLVITQHESRPSQAQEHNAGLCTKMNRNIAVIDRAWEKKSFKSQKKIRV